mmetsp:Transcript_145535/g.465098  ORF Transcript_145535/g.465098 Transcript_145535/m.465098 type:complete len:126 (-) Transcript_145535:71-448(-)
MGCACGRKLWDYPPDCEWFSSWQAQQQQPGPMNAGARPSLLPGTRSASGRSWARLPSGTTTLVPTASATGIAGLPPAGLFDPNSPTSAYRLYAGQTSRATTAVSLPALQSMRSVMPDFGYAPAVR